MKNPAKLIRFLAHTGHLRYPFGVEQDCPDDIDRLTLSDACVREAVRSHQALDANYDQFAAAVHGRPIVADGDVGPVTELVTDLPRCGSPDYTRPVAAAVGSGNWKRCHGVGDFHAVSVSVNNSPPSFLAPHFDEVKRRVVEAYSEVGLLVHFDGRAPVNINFSFVSSSSGWIGLAIVGQGETCTSSPIWCRYLATYRGGSTDEQIVTQWTTLIKHELGHNCGMGHARGGVMNPSIVNGLPVSWRGDPSESLLKSRFGGQPVPTGDRDHERKLVVAWEYPDGRFERVADVPQVGGGFWPS